MTETGNIYKTILEIQKKVPTLQKNGVGPSTQGSYKFLSVDDILSAVKPLLDEHGVIVVPTLLDHGYEFSKAEVKPDGRTPKVATISWVKYEFRFVDTSDGSSISTVVLAEGADSSDKSTRKSTTSAWKIALIQTFALITGEVDPDAQDGANVREDVAPGSSYGNQKIEKARTAAPAAKSADPIAAKRSELQAVAAELDLNFNDQVLALGDTKFGARGSWTNSVAQIDELIAAIRNGEVA